MDLDSLIDVAGADSVVADELELACYSRDMSIHLGCPEAVVLPRDVEHVQRIMRWSHAHDVPVTPRGAGTSVTGAILPLRGGIVMDLSRMNRVLEVRRDDGLAVVEAGTVCKDLNAALAPTHFFAPDPGSSSVCTIGGMVACNASGLRAVKYGTTKDHVLALKAVLADGTIIKTGAEAPKNSSGLDLTRLLVCSEGTLAVIVEVTVKILPVPQKVAFARSLFRSVEDAGRTVSEILARGIPLAVCEIMDRVSIQVVNKATGLGLPEAEAMLLMEVDGHPAAVEDQVQKIRHIAEEHGAFDVMASDDPRVRGSIWRGRQALVPSLSRLEPGKRLIPICEDIGVPISKIPETIRRTQELAREHEILVATFGHVGDGNVHATFIGDVRSEKDWEKIRRMGEGLVQLALELGGTLTAEHGVGIARSPYLRREHGPAVNVMRAVKSAIDPKGLMNPGKVGLDDVIADPFDCFAFEPVVGRPPSMRSLGDEVDNEVLVCVQCGFCRAVCPVFSVTGQESTNARGRMILAYDYLAGKIRPSENLASRFFRCTTCGSCTTACPSRLKVVDVIEACRRELTAAGFGPPPVLAAIESIEARGNPYGMDAAGRLESCPRELRSRPAPASPEALLYLGCVPSLIDTRMTPASIRLLDRAGVAVATLGERETCCGYLAHLAGDETAFRASAERNAALLRGAGAPLVVTPCAGCYKTLHQLYPRLGVDVGAGVTHLSSYLLELVRAGRLVPGKPVNARVTYHDPCDLGRHLGITEEPRQLLRTLPGLDLVEMPRNRDQARCCGGGGGIGATDPDLGVAMAVARVKDAEAVGAEVLVSACAACKKNLSRGAQQHRRFGGKKIKVVDLTELVMSALE
jgi:glycolate oxidase